MARPEPLDSPTLEAFLARSPAWTMSDGMLVRAATAPTFPAAISWVVAVAEAAEQANHHPDIDIRWRTVTFRLATHDAGAITSLDLDLAAHIDTVVDASP